MKKNIIIAIVYLTLLCTFSSCNKEAQNWDKKIKENIIGKWMSVKDNGTEILTNEREIQTYFTDGNCTVSISTSDIWLSKIEWKYSVENGKILRNTTNNSDIQALAVESIDNDKVVFSYIKSVLYPQLASETPKEYAKINIDYSSAILGLWEGVKFEGEETYGDANHRWEYRIDGTYTYYEKVGDDWQPSTDIMNAYFVDGKYLATMWKETENVTLREWWDIEVCNEIEMVWTSLRQREDGTRYTQKFILKKIN